MNIFMRQELFTAVQVPSCRPPFKEDQRSMQCERTYPLWQALRRDADGRALVLLDEVGTGTDPAEGAALGIALLRTLAAGGPRGAAVTIATTHHR